jgi:membrane-associated protease RseP (regulator of RpoE activity)
MRRLLVVGLAAAAVLTITLPAHTQGPLPGPANSPGGQPTVIHIHHHHYYPNPGSNATEIGSYYSPTYAWNFGYQPGTGGFIRPWKQNWGHLGFTGYLGQHGGGVDITPESLNVFTGLVVDTVTPGSPASKIGLVPGDFILKIDGTPVDGYKQAAILFDQSVQGSKPEIALTVWNPTTRRTTVLKAILKKD